MREREQLASFSNPVIYSTIMTCLEAVGIGTSHYARACCVAKRGISK